MNFYKHRLRISFPCYQTPFIKPTALELFQREAVLFQAIIHGFKQQRWTNIFGEIKRVIMCTGKFV